MVDLVRTQEADLPHVQGFIRDHWKKDHVLARDLALFQWQYSDLDRGGYNMALAKRDGEIIGILGYIRSQQFERVDLSAPTVWLALWKVRDDVKIPGLGLRLVKFVADLEKPSLFAVVGINEPTIPIYQRLGYETGELDHHVFIDPERSHFQIFNSGNAPTPKSQFSSGAALRVIENWPEFANRFDGVQSADVLPRKTLSYFENRYIRHPFYNYLPISVESNGRVCGLVIMRKIAAQNSCVLRVIDALGPDEMWGALGAGLFKLIREHHAEYVDLLSRGIASDALRQSGFLNRRNFPDWIVPNYFEPFLAKNASVRWAAKIPEGARYIAFKGDGDQDRPNVSGTRSVTAP